MNVDREVRRQKITKRLKDRLDGGMIDEVRHLIQSGIDPQDLIYYGLEYKYLTLHVLGQSGRNQSGDSRRTGTNSF